MNSLLSEEIKKYNLLNNSLEKNNTKQIYEKVIIKNIEKPNFHDEEYSINMNIFNPMKNSPPNYWNYRLLNRINSLNSLNNLYKFNDPNDIKDPNNSNDINDINDTNDINDSNNINDTNDINDTNGINDSNRFNGN
tara:strand:+ start:2142 stop:2549 length:408 start_codon:yes stop_codon:yes gene_type:complete